MKAKAKAVRIAVGIVMLAVFVWLALHFLHVQQLSDAFLSLLRAPVILAVMTAAYAGSFVLKAAAWRIYSGAEQPLRKHLAPLGYSLLVNHMLPVKMGDLVRTGLAARLERKSWDVALHTVAVMRAMDISVLLLFALYGLAVWGVPWEPYTGWGAIIVSILVFLLVVVGLFYANTRGITFVSRHIALLQKLRTPKAALAWAITVISWVLEGIVPYGVLLAMHTHISAAEAVWVNSITVGGQLFHVTPGGIGTYESSMAASLAALGIDGSSAMTAAVVSHGYKFLFAFAAGFVSWTLLPVRLEEGVRWLSRRPMNKEDPLA